MAIKIPYQVGKCPHCGAELGVSNDYVYYYGSPIRSCKKCGKEYIDKRYHEIEIDGIKEEDLSVKGNGKLFFGSLAVSIVLLLLFLLGLQVGRIYFGLIVGLVLSCAASVFTIYETINIKSGSKAKELKKEQEASVKRMQNKEYAHLLHSLGYSVPEKYL